MPSTALPPPDSARFARRASAEEIASATTGDADDILWIEDGPTGLLALPIHGVRVDSGIAARDALVRHPDGKWADITVRFTFRSGRVSTLGITSTHRGLTQYVTRGLPIKVMEGAARRVLGEAMAESHLLMRMKVARDEELAQLAQLDGIAADFEAEGRRGRAPRSDRDLAGIARAYLLLAHDGKGHELQRLAEKYGTTVAWIKSGLRAAQSRDIFGRQGLGRGVRGGDLTDYGDRLLAGEETT